MRSLGTVFISPKRPFSTFLEPKNLILKVSKAAASAGLAELISARNPSILLNASKVYNLHKVIGQSYVLLLTQLINLAYDARDKDNETISARSHCQFHQIEGLYIDEKVSFADMKQTLLYFAREMYGPKTDIRLRPSYFPFTEPSAEMDVWLGTDTPATKKLTKGTGWLEVLGCGMVDPNVLKNCDIDPEKYTGYAFGIGIERTAMQNFNISDIRLLFENDVRFLRQFSSVI